MDIYEMLKMEQRSKKIGEPVKEQYGRVEIDLSTARVDEAIHIAGNHITIAFCDGASTTTYFKLNNKHSRNLYPAEITKVMGNFGGLYMTNDAEAGKKLIIYIGRDIFIFPARAEANRILKSDGTTINPARDERYQAHTIGQVDRRVLGTIDEAEGIATTSTKVKWAIIHVDTADVMIGDSTLTNKAGGHAGVLVSDGSDFVVEYCDLNDVYIVNEDGAVKPYFSAIYAVEEE